MTYWVERIQKCVPVREEPVGEEFEEQKRASLWYQGRQWRKALSDIAITCPSMIPLSSAQRVYADRILEGAASRWLGRMMTLEERVAQLCFYETEAYYDATVQHEVELLIQTWQVGGLLFTKGLYPRQAYLIEGFQKISKTPLLVANDLFHGLSLYLEEDQLPGWDGSERRFSDLGKVVMELNRHLGVQIQCVQERAGATLPMNVKQAQALRRGIREAQGVVGKIGHDLAPAASYERPLFACFPLFTYADRRLCDTMGETIGFRTITFYDLTTPSADWEEKLYLAFKGHYDAFLFRDNLPEAIRIFCKLIRKGELREQELERRVIKLLIIKALYFSESARKPKR